MKYAIAGMLAAGVTATALGGVHRTTVTFDNGWENWMGSGASIQGDGGNPGAHAHTELENFGVEYLTNSNQDFLGDYRQYSSVTLSIDVKTNVINFFGTPVTRDLVLDLRNTEAGQNGYPWSSVWIPLGTLEGGQEWTTFSITFDPNSTEMPAGWGGTGDENQFAEPKLPDNLTFADIMANVDMVSFSTYTPGFLYSISTYFDLQVDNIRIEASLIPAPGAAALLLGVFGVGVSRRRRR